MKPETAFELLRGSRSACPCIKSSEKRVNEGRGLICNCGVKGGPVPCLDCTFCEAMKQDVLA